MEEQTGQSYSIIIKEGMCEIEEKKSRFLASVFPAETEEEAIERIAAVRKKYWDARHHCYAYVLGGKADLVRCSDDGEPGGTAGKPILEVLLGKGLRNAVIVVTRYFGGTLLGTGGLVRAYTKAAQGGIADCTIAVMRYGTMVKIQTDYQGIGKIQHLLASRQIEPEECSYLETVILQVTAAQEEIENLKNEMIEATNGKAVVEEQGSRYFIDNKAGI